MASLADHLLGAAQHDRLPFRADCPLCQSRVAGRLPEPRLLSRRSEARAAAGLIAASSLLAPTGSLAEPGPPTPPPVVLDEPSPPGEPPVVLAPPPPEPDAAAPELDHPRADDVHPLTAPEPPETESAPAPQPRERTDPPPTAGRPDQQAPAEATTPELEERSESVERAPQRPSPGRLAPPVVVPEDQAAAPTPSDESESLRSPLGTYVVQPGDCLWSIAESHLEDGADDARVAMAVERLWELNGDRIATGDPDLIHPGQRLQLP